MKKSIGHLYKRGSIWWMRISIRGKRIYKSSKCSRESDAREALKKLIADARSGKRVEAGVDKVTLAGLLDTVRSHYVVNGRRSITRLKSSTAMLTGFFGAQTLAADIHETRIEAFKAACKDDGYANATINRALALLKHGFKLSRKQLSTLPDISMLDESDNVRQGFVSHEQFLRLVENLPGDLRDPVRFLYYASWRPKEMRTLQWKDVDLIENVIRLRTEHSKNKGTRTLPLRGEIKQVIEHAAQERRLDCPHVFHRDGKPIGSFRKAWATACRKTGLGKIVVYDLRRSGIRHMTRAGVDPKIAMQISGHRTLSTFYRYDITDEEDLARALDRRDEYLSNQPVGITKVVPISREG